jgi:transposase
MRSRIEPLKKFARNLKTKLEGILAHCRWPLHTSLLEGINPELRSRRLDLKRSPGRFC